jgi:hypothetical protein
MRLLFEKSNRFDPLELLTAWVTHGPYCHVELEFTGGLCFSSSPIYGGTKFHLLDEPERYVPLDLNVSFDDECKIFQWCRGEVGCGYDYLGVLAFICPYIHQSKKRWFCSEVCLTALQQVGLFLGLDPYHVSPNELATIVQKRGSLTFLGCLVDMARHGRF